MGSNTAVTTDQITGADVRTASLSGLKMSYGLKPAVRRKAFSASDEPQSTDRRASRRYSINLTGRYTIGNAVDRPGTEARVINISSSGILLQSDRPLGPGLKIRLRIDWPALLNNMVPLALHIEGHTVRGAGTLVGVKILRSEFRTRTVAQSAPAACPTR